MLRILEKVVEWILWQSRLMIFLAVVAAIISAFILVIVGTLEVYHVIEKAGKLISGQISFETFYKYAIKNIVTAVDIYLISTVLLIFGIGLYELFISKIDYVEYDQRSSRILVVHTLDQLKEKLAKVILMVLIVTFFKYAIDFHYEDVKSLLLLSIGILLIALSIYLMHKGHSEEENNNEH